LTRYKLAVRGAEGFATVYDDPLNMMVDQNKPLASWHGRHGHSETLFLDGHADYLLTSTAGPDGRTRNRECTLWFNDTPEGIPAPLKPPYPGIREYIP
jgi:hypothetical protein